jgi:hypothetical protein
MAQVYGEVASERSLEDFASLLDQDGWQVDLGRYAVRLSDPSCACKFEPVDGGFLLADGIESEDLLHGAQTLSRHLAARDVRHRLEVYEGDALVAYLHHGWPRT